MKGRFRLLVSLGIAAVLSTFMLYTALVGGDVQRPVVEARELPQRRSIMKRETVQFVGVAAGPIKGDAHGDTFMYFAITDRKGHNRVRIKYRGSVPDAFKVGRNVVVSGRLHGNTLVAEPDSLATKCPSKFVGEKRKKWDKENS